MIAFWPRSNRLLLAQILEDRLVPPIGLGLLQQRAVEHPVQRRVELGQGDGVMLALQDDLQHAQLRGEVLQHEPGQQRLVVHECVEIVGFQRLQGVDRGGKRLV